MKRFYLWMPVLFLIVTGAARSEDAKKRPVSSEPEKQTQDCQEKIYSLRSLTARFGDDPALGEWIATTIPEVIQPGTWREEGGPGKLSYFPPGKILVVYHSAT